MGFRNKEADDDSILKRKMVFLSGGFLIDLSSIRSVRLSEDDDFDADPPVTKYVMIINGREKILYNSPRERDEAFVGISALLRADDSVEIIGDSGINLNNYKYEEGEDDNNIGEDRPDDEIEPESKRKVRGSRKRS